MRIITASVLTLLVAAPATARECDPDRTLYIGETVEGRDLKTIAYFPEGRTPSAPVRFEGWQGKAMQWRVTGTLYCSNDIVICGVSIPLSDGQSLEVDETSVMEGDRPVYLVLSTLLQSSYTSQRGEPATTFQAEWTGKAPVSDPNDPAILLPSVWKASGCAK
ncbi:hypothetical protein [Aureimonas jatrophae]|uniref:hypothetical protein n=1 Tax=Aureimonas jatrophae TaxID=1166073 RepID=UPI00160692BD|nr:hypothetical protein [Aureimonas jatrophae]MBB3950472.1 hypothetical protein [Aureimonas jatrophae]